MSPDVIIVGAGIIGAACARALAAAGLSVTVLDGSAAASGTSGQGEGNILVSDKGAGPELVLAQRSLVLWDGLVASLGEELPPAVRAALPPIEYERKGGLVVATTGAGAEPLLDFAREQREAGVDARPVDRGTALRLEPSLNPAVTAAVHYPQDAQVQPVIAVETFLAAARVQGADIRYGEAVTGALRAGDGRITGVRTARGSVSASHVIVAAGPWSGRVAGLLGTTLPVRPRRGVMLVTTRMPHRVFRKVYDADYVGAVGSGDAALQTSSVIESTAAGSVLVGSSRRQQGFDASLDPAAMREIAAKATRVFPFLAQASVLRVYGGFRPFMPDHLPAIGPDPRIPGLWHATGHEGAGIGLALGTAELLRDLITGATPAVDPRPFSPGRPGVTAALASEPGPPGPSGTSGTSDGEAA
jgi:glycine/D-amino acid oxidase-like deaminating enzyme